MCVFRSLVVLKESLHWMHSAAHEWSLPRLCIFNLSNMCCAISKILGQLKTALIQKLYPNKTYLKQVKVLQKWFFENSESMMILCQNLHPPASSFHPNPTPTSNLTGYRGDLKFPGRCDRFLFFRYIFGIFFILGTFFIFGTCFESWDIWEMLNLLWNLGLFWNLGHFEIRDILKLFNLG